MESELILAQARVRPDLESIPKLPGIYIFFAPDETILYVGKAKNLYSRLSQYFRPAQKLHGRISEMLVKAQRVEWIITQSEVEALILEAKYIRKNQPKYNVKLLDTDPYGGIAISNNYPQKIFTWRGKRPNSVKSYGPFPGVRSKNIIDSLTKSFGLRSCKDTQFKRSSLLQKPCLLGEIGQCVAPCLTSTPKSVVDASLKNTLNFLDGEKGDILSFVIEERDKAARDENFELAAKKRDQHSALLKIAQIQNIDVGNKIDVDAFALSIESDIGVMTQVTVRNGELISLVTSQVDVDTNLTVDENYLQILANNLTAEKNEIYSLKYVLLDRNIEKNLKLTLEKEFTIKILSRDNNKYKPIIILAEKNSIENLPYLLLRNTTRLSSRLEALDELSKILGSSNKITRIECLDISHTQGKFPVASVVVSQEGMLLPSQYRKVHLPADIGGDDYGSLRAAILKRMTNSHMGYKELPQLFVIDGGALQVAAVHSELEKLLLGSDLDICVIGLAKRMEEIYLPNNPLPLILPRSSQALIILQRIRDEAHRYAIISHRKLRDKNVLKTSLDDIPGLGKAKLKLLVSNFGNLESVYSATEGELSQVSGIGDKLASVIYKNLHS